MVEMVISETSRDQGRDAVASGVPAGGEADMGCRCSASSAPVRLHCLYRLAGVFERVGLKLLAAPARPVEISRWHGVALHDLAIKLNFVAAVLVGLDLVSELLALNAGVPDSCHRRYCGVLGLVVVIIIVLLLMGRL